MTDLINLDAESGRNIIGDDSTPTLELENTSSGYAFKATTRSGTGAGAYFEAQASTPTVAPLVVVASAASGAALEFRGSFGSIASVGSITRGLRVKIGNSYYWLPLYESATYI